MIRRFIYEQDDIIYIYIYNFNKNGKNCGWKYIWCAKSEVIFSTLNVYYMKLRGPIYINYISSDKSSYKFYKSVQIIILSIRIQKI
jgi:hypothetical protein